MANRLIPDEPPQIFLREWIAIRTTGDPNGKPDLSKFEDDTGVDYHLVYRYLDGTRDPDLPSLKYLADALKISIADLFRHPSEASEDSLMGDLAPAAQQQARDFINYLRSRQE